MAGFEQAREKYRTARQASFDLRAKLVAARERARKLAREEARLRRTTAGDALDDLLTAREAAEDEARRLRGRFRGARANESAALADFAGHADPTTAIPWPDEVPIALLPLRLETRYRRTGTALQLMVRVFPDDILVDTYQPEISRTELDNAVNYWNQRWRAAGRYEGRRAAWVALAKAHGAGRAQWLIGKVAPLNPVDEPSLGPEMHVLAVLPPSPLPTAEKAAIGAFWERVWASSGAERTQAFADLASVVGASRAVEVEAGLAPVNLHDANVKADGTRTPVVAFLDMPDPATLPVSQDDWTRGARTWLMPERLVLLGYRDGTEVLRLTSEPIPSELQVGPDPSADKDEQVTADGPDLVIPDALRWTVDFEEAKARGLGFVVDLVDEASARFDRLFVIGLRLSSNGDEAANELEALIRHHQASRKGFTLLPQGRPTNNTDLGSAGYSWWEDPGEAYDHFFPAQPHADPSGWQDRKDGAWLAGLVGLDPAVLRQSPGYFGTDQAEARAMNVALWPATLGYYMEQLMEPVFSETSTKQTREFFNRFVTGRGTLPLIRVGRQPYGIVPACAWSRASWWHDPTYERAAASTGLPPRDYLDDLQALGERATGFWNRFARNVPHLGMRTSDAHQQLLDIIGLHPASVEFFQRYSQTFTQFYNLLGFETDLVSAPITQAGRDYMLAGLETLEELGWTLPSGTELPDLIEKIFLKAPNLLKGDQVAPLLSEREPLPITRADGLNYVAWLQQAARSSHHTLRMQDGFAPAPPTELLYLMLHHALDLGFIEGELDLRRKALQLSDAELRLAKKEPKLLAVGEQSPRSRWTALYQTQAAITGNATVRVGDFLPGVAADRGLYLSQQLDALDKLKNAPTARLERAFVEHLDTLSYRLDAWRLGLQGVQLSYLRGESEAGFARRGVHVGAYGWIEQLAPRSGAPEAVTLDPELAAIFDTPGAAPLIREAGNHGHIHAPSLDQAVTAAILRNGHKTHATAEDPDALAIDLSSERVRLALRVIDGMRAGQSLGALLGYQLERALHDEPGVFLDRLIHELRRAFPLAGNRNELTKVDNLDSIGKVEARNVLNGADLADQIDEKKIVTYPYGVEGLPPLSELTGPGLPTAAEIGASIDSHVAKMLGIADAVADIAIAEGVYQLVRGNPERAAGSLDAFGKGGYPPEVEVVATPRSGRTITHRVAIHLPGSVAAGGVAEPRAKGEPALARWLEDRMPSPEGVFARVSWQGSVGGSGDVTPSMKELGLSCVDLFYMLDAGGAHEMAGFDDLLIDHAERTGSPPHDALFSLEYMPDGAAGLTLFELAPLVRSLRGLLLGARPVRPTDLSLSEEATKNEEVQPALRPDKVQAVRAELAPALAPIDGFVTTLKDAIGPGVAEADALDAAQASIDQWLADYAGLARSLVPFGLKAASLTAGIEARRHPFELMQEALVEVEERWLRLRDEHDAVLARLPFAATDEERTAILLRAASLVSTVVIVPLPSTVVALEAAVGALKGTLDDRLTALAALRAGQRTVGTLLAAITALVPLMATVDAAPFDLGRLRTSALGLARELDRRAQQLKADVEGRLAAADAALAVVGTATGDKAQAAIEKGARALLGEAFVVLPEFRLSPARLAEWDKSWTDRAGLMDHLKTGPSTTPFPLDDWLHGLARVRERPRHLEMAKLLGPVLGAPGQVILETVQFPFRQGDVWAAMTLPVTFRDGEPFVLDRDKLVYTAHFGNGGEIDPADDTKTYCGLMVDEWTELIPSPRETTGLAFHYDRPSNEAPQAILLVTPSEHRGAWTFDHIVDAMHETLDMSRLRAVEPAFIQQSKLGPFLPAILSAVTTYPITSMLNFAFNNNVQLAMAEASNE